MKRQALQVMIATILSKLLGFVREVALSYAYGASATTDAYLISQTIPVVVFSFISAGVATAFIPNYSGILNKNGRNQADRYTSNLCNALLLVASVLVALIFLFTRPIVKVFASGFSGEMLLLTIKLTRVSVFGIYFTGIIGVFTAYLRLHGNFIVPALISLPMNLVIISSVFVSSKTNIYVLAAGGVIAAASQLIVCILFSRLAGYQHKPIMDIKDEHLKAMVLMALPVIAGTAVSEVNVLIDRTLASGIALGGISSLNYANRLTNFVRGLFVVSVTTVLYPLISRMAAEGKMVRLKGYLAEAISMVSIMVVPAAVGAMIFCREVVVLVFGRGAFTHEAIEMTSKALFYYSIGMIGFGLIEVLTRAFYSLRDTKTPVRCTVVVVLANIVPNILLSRVMGIPGLALATSISGILGALVMSIYLRRRIGSFGLRTISLSFFKICIASLVMGLLARGSLTIANQVLHRNVALLVAIAVGALTYGLLIFNMRIPEVDRTWVAVKQRLVGLTDKNN